MTSRIEQALAERGFTLPEAAAPVANYVPFANSGRQIFISGQLPLTPQGLIEGTLGASCGLEDGIRAAEACSLNLLAQLKAACAGNLDQVGRCLRLGGFVASSPDFRDHAKVMNGASDLIGAAMGEDGKHARAAVGVASLPLGAAVEIDGIFELRD